jgi:hypothetical protein
MDGSCETPVSEGSWAYFGQSYRGALAGARVDAAATVVTEAPAIAAAAATVAVARRTEKRDTVVNPS